MGNRTGEFVLSEANGTLSRESIVIASGSGVLSPGTVVGKVTASGKYVPYVNTNSNGSEVAAGVIYEKVDATSADQDVVAYVREAEVASSKLVWAAGNDAAAIAAGVADLLTKTIIVRS